MRRTQVSAALAAIVVTAEKTPLNVDTGTVAIGSVTESQPGEAPITVSVPSGVEEGTYEIDVEVKYSYTYQQSDDITYGRVKTINEEIEVEVNDDARFEIINVTTEARIGDQGTLEAMIKNVGADTALDATVSLESLSAGLAFGESTEFSLPVSIGGEAEGGLRSLDMAVQYRTDEGAVRADERLAVDAHVAPEREQFDVAVQNRTVQSGGTRTVDVAVTNNLNETVSNAEARLFADSPLGTGTADTGYAQSLAPGETTTMAFTLTTTVSASAGSTYPISFDFRYDSADGDSQLTDTYRIPIDVSESEGGGLPLGMIAIVLLIDGTGGLVVYWGRT